MSRRSDLCHACLDWRVAVAVAVSVSIAVLDLLDRRRACRGHKGHRLGCLAVDVLGFDGLQWGVVCDSEARL
jgi:hypothetical protein